MFQFHCLLHVRAKERESAGGVNYDSTSTDMDIPLKGLVNIHLIGVLEERDKSRDYEYCMLHRKKVLGFQSS